MAIPQSYLDGMRAQAGMGVGNFTRPSYRRSQDQNNTISGNPNYVPNMPNWQQLAAQQMQNRQMLAQDPTNIRYIQPQLNQQMQSQMAARAAGMTPLQYAQQQYQQGNQNIDPNAINAAMMAQRNTPLQNGGSNNFQTQMGNYDGSGGGMPNLNYTQPRLALQAMMGQGGQPGQLGGSPVPRNLSAGPSGFRYVRPMMR